MCHTHVGAKVSVSPAIRATPAATRREGCGCQSARGVTVTVLPPLSDVRLQDGRRRPVPYRQEGCGGRRRMRLLLERDYRSRPDLSPLRMAEFVRRCPHLFTNLGCGGLAVDP